MLVDVQTLDGIGTSEIWKMVSRLKLMTCGVIYGTDVGF